MYRFDVGPVGGVTVPAPAFWTGLRDFFRHGTGGHPSYLFGQVRLGGWWYYDLVALTVKTPIPLLLFSALGSWLVVAEVRQVRREAPAQNVLRHLERQAPAQNATQPERDSLLRIAPLIGVLSIIGLASATPVDLGVRLDLPVYPLMAILAALGLSAALARARTLVPRVALACLGAWAAAVPIAAHPDHIAYFNMLAGREPSRILVDSNLDWGQDLYRLREVVDSLGVDSLRVHYFGTAEFAAVGLERTRRLRPDERATGWVAASETFYAGVWADTSLAWLHAFEPVRRVGKSIRLYHIAPAP
jgi:hypothetical protein